MGDYFGLFDAKFPAHAVVVKRSNGRRFDNIKSSQIAARVASIPVCHDLNVPELFRTHS